MVRSPEVRRPGLAPVFSFSVHKWKSAYTLKVADDDFVVVGAGEEMMGSRREAHRANVAAVRAEGLNYATASDVVQHGGAVLLTGGQQAAAGVHGY